MTLLPRGVVILALSALFAAPMFGQQSQQTGSPVQIAASDSPSPNLASAPVPLSSGVRPQMAAPEVSGETWFFRHYGIGTFGSPLGAGGRIAVSLTRDFNLRAGGSFFSLSLNRTESGIPYTADVRLQSEQANVDWYPFHGSFHVSPGVLFGNSNRVYGSATVTADQSFTLNGVTYYSNATTPVQASGRLEFRHVSPTLTIGRGNWIRHPEEKHGAGHWTFPFEAGVAFVGDPKTDLNYSGVVCTDGQQFCQNIATDAPVQANIQVERTKLQNDANWARFYPIIAGGVVYRF